MRPGHLSGHRARRASAQQAWVPPEGAPVRRAFPFMAVARSAPRLRSARPPGRPTFYQAGWPAPASCGRRRPLREARGQGTVWLAEPVGDDPPLWLLSGVTVTAVADPPRAIAEGRALRSARLGPVNVNGPLVKPARGRLTAIPAEPQPVLLGSRLRVADLARGTPAGRAA
jgi:hypothetical protein